MSSVKRMGTHLAKRILSERPVSPVYAVKALSVLCSVYAYGVTPVPPPVTDRDAPSVVAVADATLPCLIRVSLNYFVSRATWEINYKKYVS